MNVRSIYIVCGHIEPDVTASLLAGTRDELKQEKA